jgi:uncharacterized protein
MERRMHPLLVRRSLALSAALGALFAFLSDGFAIAAEPKEKEPTSTNRLAKESSPYLLQHAHNPVDWFPWGAEAFEKARKEKKFIFLSIGYSSCHWCHVMERESFSNKEVAEILNKHFVCIKVDREERPDIDEIYMTALHVMGGRGGWPLSMFLTANGKPIVGGTYWPREDQKIEGETALGFKSVLAKIIELHRDREKELQEQADHLAEHTQQALERASRGVALVELNRGLVASAAEALKEDLDPVYGGIGSAARRHRGTKFPMPSAMRLLLQYAVREKDEELKGLVALTLEKMALGGIYDHLGGGFHRYSTERTWTVPHFEKMLYDNAQLVELYARAYAADPRPLYRKVMRETLGFVRREMTSPEGAFYSALDADSDGKEGEFYVWTPEEINQALADEASAALFRAAYGISGNPNFEEKAFILRVPRPLAEIAKEQKLTEAELEYKLEVLRPKLLEHRNQRKRPFLDTKVLTAWNGQMIAGYALAGQVLKEPEYIQTAEKAADFVLGRLRTKDGRLLRTYNASGDGKSEARLNAYLDDHAFLIHGLLNLHDATGSKRWLNEAKELTETVVKWHGDGERGGYFYTSSDHEKLFARPKDYADGAQPSGNSVMASNLVRLWRATSDDRYRLLAEKSFKQFAGVLKSNGSAVPYLAAALASYLDAKGKPAEAAVQKEEPKTASGARKSDAVVKLAASAEKPGAEGRQTIAITLTIEKPWHIYANPVGLKSLEESQTTVRILHQGKELSAQVEYPKGTLVKDKIVGDYLVYEGEVRISAQVSRSKDADGPLDVEVHVQACTEKQCLVGARLKTSIK